MQPNEKYTSIRVNPFNITILMIAQKCYCAITFLFFIWKNVDCLCKKPTFFFFYTRSNEPEFLQLNELNDVSSFAGKLKNRFTYYLYTLSKNTSLPAEYTGRFLPHTFFFFFLYRKTYSKICLLLFATDFDEKIKYNHC